MNTSDALPSTRGRMSRVCVYCRPGAWHSSAKMMETGWKVQLPGGGKAIGPQAVALRWFAWLTGNLLARAYSRRLSSAVSSAADRPPVNAAC